MLTNIFGKRGAGKTTMIRGAIPLCQPPVVVVDILGNFSDLEAYHSTSVADAVSFVREYRRAQDEGTLMEETADVTVLQATDPNEAVNYMSSCLWHAEGGTLVLDEVDAVSTSKDAAPVFDQVIRYGRNRGVSLLTGCRRPAEIDRNITAGANRLYIFQTQEPRDIEYFRKTILGDEAEKLLSLPQYHGVFLDYDRKVVGEFEMNKNGEVFHLSEQQLKL